MEVAGPNMVFFSMQLLLWEFRMARNMNEDVLLKGMSREKSSPSAQCRSFFSAFSPTVCTSAPRVVFVGRYGRLAGSHAETNQGCSFLWFHSAAVTAPFVF